MQAFPSPDELIRKIPLKPPQAQFISESRKQVCNILTGLDPRLLLIVGPCSIHNTQSALEYAHKLRALIPKISDVFFVVMRTYFEKPRTIKGWKGLVYDPFLDGSHNLFEGLKMSRELLSDLCTLEIPCGSELLDIMTPGYYADFLTWGCIGARTCTSQPHRQMTSSLPFAVGFKNTMDGCIDNAIHAILSASSPHSFLKMAHDGRLAQIDSIGNPYCHIILRGSDATPNYDSFYVDKALQKCRQFSLDNRLVIDCSHDNCQKKHRLQVLVFETVIDQILKGKQEIIGLMLESFLEEGNQQWSSSPHPKLSVTDPCLDWDSTESMILSAYDALAQQRLAISLR